jgi:uncharacterized membrane protein
MSGYYDLYIFAVFKLMLIFHYMYVVLVAFSEKTKQASNAEKKGAALEVA